MNTAERKLYTEILMNLMSFAVFWQNHNCVFSSYDEQGEAAATVGIIIKSGIANKALPLAKNELLQDYQITLSLPKCREYFNQRSPIDGYDLPRLVGAFFISTNYRNDCPLYNGVKPFGIDEKYVIILNLLVDCGFAEKTERSKFKWTDKMAGVFYQNEIWMTSTIDGFVKLRTNILNEQLDELISRNIIAKLPNGAFKWIDRSISLNQEQDVDHYQWNSPLRQHFERLSKREFSKDEWFDIA